MNKQSKISPLSTVADIKTQLQSHIDSHKTAGQRWPDMAEFAVKYKPQNEQISVLEFFLNREDLESWITENQNAGIPFQAYEWDLGPNPMFGYHRYVDQLTLTKAEREA